jgi:hypothetical protein
MNCKMTSLSACDMSHEGKSTRRAHHLSTVVQSDEHDAGHLGAPYATPSHVGRQLCHVAAVTCRGLGVPLAAYFGLYLGWSVKGFWAALMITSAVMAVVQLAVIARFDWHQEVQRTAQLMGQHEDQAVERKAADLAAAVQAPSVIRAVGSCGTVSPEVTSGAVLQSAGSEVSQGSREGSQGDESDTAPLLDARRVSGPIVGGAKSGAGIQQQLRVGSDHGVRQQSRLSRVSGSGQWAAGAAGAERQSRWKVGRAWLHWPFTRRAGGDETVGQEQQVAASSPQQLHQQSSLTRSLIGSRLLDGGRS